jgi:hypothetical protein
MVNLCSETGIASKIKIGLHIISLFAVLPNP